MEVCRQLHAPASCTRNGSGHFAEDEFRLTEIELRFFGRPAHILLVTPKELYRLHLCLYLLLEVACDVCVCASLRTVF